MLLILLSVFLLGCSLSASSSWSSLEEFFLKGRNTIFLRREVSRMTLAKKIAKARQGVFGGERIPIRVK